MQVGLMIPNKFQYLFSTLGLDEPNLWNCKSNNQVVSDGDDSSQIFYYDFHVVSKFMFISKT